MRAPIEWLADYVDIDLPTEDLALQLTMAGLKVEAVHRIGADWQDVVTGAVEELAPHPTSRNPLNVAKVNLGERTITVVTGAQNVRQGDRVAVVLVGGLLPHGPDGEPMVIQAKPMAGITSEGMLASARELGISDDHSGIYILPPDVPVGVPLRQVMGGDVLDIETNINRPDTLSIIGVAREIAAITGQQLTLPDLDAVGGSVTWLDEESIQVEIDAPDLCPRYSALRIEDAEVAASPYWLAGRLQAAGMRPINNLVDITNYVMLEYGQPMHAFDATRLHGGTIVVRRAAEGEHLRTLDGVDRTLTHDNLLIADGERSVAIAGVMGGEESEISPDTTTIVLESATFDPISVRRTSQSLKLRTESSIRFEKGLPPEQTVLGARRFLQLLAQISPQSLRAARISDAWVTHPQARIVAMPIRDLDRLVGIPISPERAAEALSLLGFDAVVEDSGISVRVPFWRRVDIERSADLVEEVARMVGFDTLPSTLPRRTVSPPAPLPELHWEDVVRDRLLSAGVSEVVTGTLTSSPSMARLFRPGSDGQGADSEEQWARLIPNPAGVYAREALIHSLRLLNPPSQDRQLLRLTLLPSVLDVVARNLRHTEERLSFFEIARTYFQRPEDLPYERRTLALALSGRREPRSWQNPSPAPYSFYDLKGVVEAVLDELQIADWQVEPQDHPALHPGRSAVLCLDGRDVAFFGELHPDVAAAFDIESWPVQVAEIDLDALFTAAWPSRTFRSLPRYPAALSGRREPRSWQNPSPAPYSFYDLKGVVEAVLDELQIADWQVEPHDHPALHPGRSAVLCLDGRDVAFFGELHPDVAAAFDIESWPVQVAEIDLDTLFAQSSTNRTFRSLPRYPAALRDIAVVLDADVPAAQVMHIVRTAGGDLLESAEIFDVYVGDPLPPAKKSVAVSLELRAPGATLTQEEVNEVMDRITNALKRELNAMLRE